MVTGAIGALLLFYSVKNGRKDASLPRYWPRSSASCFGRVIAVSDRHRGCCSDGLFRMEMMKQDDKQDDILYSEKRSLPQLHMTQALMQSGKTFEKNK
ncbi:hypothetical protein PO124_07785 [Bacillus licheniformis]|nr:hypothetical protein [Bacillus licheniformis]